VSDDKLVVLDPKRVRKRKGSGRPPGRPSAYTPALGLKICEIIATHSCGFESMRERYPDIFPKLPSLFYWRRQHPEFNTAYEQAVEARATLLLFETIEIADDDSRDLIVVDGETRPNPAAVQRSKLMNDTRLAAVKLMAPRIYGDKLDINASLNLGYLPQSEAIHLLK
jgi:hypothetical protein